MSIVDSVRSAAKSLAWFFDGVLGGDAYAKYVAHHERQHGSDESCHVMTEREFWRDHTDRQDANPQGRCC
jgi:uncharacterized short protein YbdD (DUF466 family)